VNDRLYVFGSSIEKTVLVLNLKEFTLSNVRTAGIEPGDSEHITTVAVGGIIFAFETRQEGARKRLFAFDCERLKWHSYAVDEEKAVGKWPSIVFYDDTERRIIAVWEGDGDDRVAEIRVGEPLGMLGHTFDMLGQLGGK
jgi:hypothetical protein